jgi:hypothetical protein
MLDVMMCRHRYDKIASEILLYYVNFNSKKFKKGPLSIKAFFSFKMCKFL